MFNILKRTNKPVRFVNIVPGVAESTPVILAKDLKRKWIEQNIKDLQQSKEKLKKCPVGQIRDFLSRNNFIVRCPGIKGFINSGYLITCPVDFTLETNGDGQNFRSEILSLTIHGTYFNGKEMSPIKIYPHVREQFHDYTPVPRNSLKNIIKLVTGWHVIPDKRFIYLITSPYYSDEDRFTSVTGILDPFYDTEINALLYWHVLNGKETIKAGTPLVQVIPIPRDFIQPDLSSGPPTVDEINKLKSAMNIPLLHAADRDLRKMKEAGEKIFAE
jgi:hypothetical protein